MLAKSIFKAASSRVSCSSRQSVRSVCKVVAQQKSLFALAQQSRMFATGSAITERGVQKLSKALEKEIKYENENYSQLEDIETFLNESGFKFTEQENGIVMTLSKTVGDKHVEVQFEAR
jgi:hypothetical protein